MNIGDIQKWNLKLNKWAFNLSVFFLLSGVGFLARADDSRSRETDSDKEEYNFNWLDPDKKIFVLQNRKYLKKGHPFLSVLGGVGFSNPYRSTVNLEPRLSYFMSEYWGVDFFYTQIFNSSNSTFQALSVAAPNTLPFIREIRAQFGGEIYYVPWYAKINVFNSIIYFDWYFGLGAGSVQSFVNTTQTSGAAANYVQDNLLGIFLSTGHLYHVSESFIVRMDMTTALYSAHINGLTGDSTWYSNINFGLGIGWRL